MNANLKKFDFDLLLKPWETERAYKDLPEDDYHYNIVAMSSGKLGHLLDSPAHFEQSCLADRAEPTPAQRFGSIFHKAVLEGPAFRKLFIVQPEFSGTGSKKAKAEWLEAHQGRIIIKTEEEDQITAMCESILRHPTAAAILQGCAGRTEISGFFNYDGVRCKMRADVWRRDDMIWDLKTTQCAAPDEFARDAWNMRYPLQAHWYSLGAQKITKRRHDFGYIVVEKKEPYPVAVYTAGAAYLTAGETLANMALKRFHAAMAAKRFRAYSDDAQELQIPAFAPRQLEDMEIAEATLYAS